MIVTASAHEAALDELTRQLDSAGMPESVGIHGPNAMAWQVNSEIINFLGAGRAILLQLAHPYVAYAIAEHSVTLDDARGRFQRTFENIYQMCFGNRDQAMQSARQVYRVHTRVHGIIAEDAGRYRRGHRYHALESEALLWVHATLIDTAMRVHAASGLSMSSDQRERFYQDSKRFALLFGLAEQVPADLDAFDRYVADRLAGDGLAVTTPAREIASFVLKAPSPALAPAFHLYRSITASLLPTHLARAYDLPCSPADLRRARLALASFTVLRRLLPDGLRLMPEAVSAEARLGLREKSRLSQLVERGMQRSLEMWSS